MSEALRDDEILLTYILRDQQDKNLTEIRARLEATGFWRSFPPAGIKIVAWHVLIGLGHVVVLKVPTARLREVNVHLEETAWGAFDTECYVTYDFAAIRAAM